MPRAPLAFLVAVLPVLGLAAIALAIHPRLPAAERGRRLAERTGCFTCHGPEGSRGAANPGRADRSVPTYEGDLMMYAERPEEIRQWIRDGATAKRSGSTTWRRERDRGVLRMPAFGHRLRASQIEDLVAFVMAVSGSPEPEDSLARRGLERSQALGCAGCHGPGGRFARPNAGSLKGYVPAWDGPDFAELVRNRQEFGEWVERGVCRRLEHHPVAQLLLKRAGLRMPAYRRHLRVGDVDALWAYVRWLRSS